MLVDNAATKAAEPPRTVWTREKCLSCHLNKKTLKLMQEKAGDPTFCQAEYDLLTGKADADKSLKNGVDWKK